MRWLLSIGDAIPAADAYVRCPVIPIIKATGAGVRLIVVVVRPDHHYWARAQLARVTPTIA